MTTELLADPDAVARAILRGSLESRCRQAPVAVLAMVFNTAFCVTLLSAGVSAQALAAWLVALTGLLALRYTVARATLKALAADSTALLPYDRRFRAISLASQIVSGAGIWIVGGSTAVLAEYLMTMLILLYASGAMINLAHDYRSFRLTIPFLAIQPILFWLFNGVGGIAVAVFILTLTLMMISSVRKSQAIFDDGVHIRFEKNELLRQLEHEKQTVLGALQQAEAANRSKSFFLAAASHDLRQPLYAAAILRDTLCLHDLPAEAHKLLEQQGKALAFASGLFDNLLDLSKFEAGAIAPTLTPIHLRDMLADIEAQFSPVCATKNLQLIIEPTELVGYSDYDLVDRLLRNLVSNAARYTEYGSIRLQVAMQGERIEVAVSDTGIGIAEEDRTRIFDEYVQIEAPAHLRERGVGLGLAIVRHISSLLDLDLRLESKVGSGTRVSIRLPLAPADIVRVVTPPERNPQVDLVGQHVWIVEDEESIRDALATYFATRNCSSSQAANRRELEAMVTKEPDFVLVDDMLRTRESGLDIARWLSKRIDARNILLMTASTDPVRLRELTASEFAVLRKPIFEDALNRWLSSRLDDTATTAAAR
jgi:two-component system, sensor histidine kinase